MRRKDREITNPARIREIIEECYCCRLGFYDKGEVYIVPLNFGYEEELGKRIFYFHGAKEGRKMSLIAQSGSTPVGFELDTGYKLNEGSTPCQYSARFSSVIGTGRVSLIDSLEERHHALCSLMAHAAGQKDYIFSEAMIQSVAVFKMEVVTLSCKEHE